MGEVYRAEDLKHFGGLVGLLGASIYASMLWVLPVSADADLWWAPMS